MSDLLDDSPQFNNNKNLFDSDDIERADFGTRLGAYLLDLVFMGGFGFVVSIFVGFVGIAFFESSNNSSNFSDAVGGFFIWLISLFWALFIGAFLYNLVEAFTGASLGKMVVGIKIGTQDAKTAFIGRYIARALLKNFQYILILLSIYTDNEIFVEVMQLYYLFFIVSCAFALSPDRLTLHDRIVSTAVYKKIHLDHNK
jgi:uncharacterized RDD family membrane protein YckC